MGFKTDCDWPGCASNRERGFVYCAEHLHVETERWLADQEQPTVPVTLNGRPAMISGIKTRFPRVVDIETGLGAEWSHKAIAHVIEHKGGAFTS